MSADGGLVNRTAAIQRNRLSALRFVLCGRIMANDRVTLALSRIEAAIDRIEAGIARAGPAPAEGDLAERHERLRVGTAAALARLDRLLGSDG